MKRKIKVFISAALCLMMVLGSGAVGGEGFAQALDTFSIKANAAENVLSYYITDGSVTICDCDESAKGEIIIPSTYKGYPVTSIGYYAFSGCAALTSITIPDSVTSIGDYAFFNCTGLTSVTISDSVTSIGIGAFEECTSLKSVTIPDSVTSIGDYAFLDCTGLTSINIPNGVTSIGEQTFFGCTGLKSITIPDSVTSIGYAAFYGCTGLKSITIPDSVTSIGYAAFYGCTGLTSVNIPNGVTSIDRYAFSGCTGLTSVTIPDSVTSIGDYAFSEVNNISYSENMKATGSPWGAECVNGFVDGYLVYYDSSKTGLCSCSTGVTGSIDISADVEYINYEAFIGCTGITRINVDRDNPDYSNDQHGVLFDKEKEYIIRYPAGNLRTRYSIPDDVEYIYPYAFEQCNNLKSITIPNGVTRIESYTFYGCTGLKNINIPGSVTNIDNDAFYGCSGLASITIPNSVTSIGKFAFSDCTALTNITIPNGVTSIESYTFYGCTGLKNINIPDSVTNIDNDAFYGCSGLTNITIPGSVTSIGEFSFENCTGLTSVNISNGVKSINYGAFAFCDNLKFVHIPESVTLIGWDILFDTPAYICSDTDNCTAKEYADENGIEFRVCDGCHISITNHKEISVDYKSKLVFHADVEYLPKGASIMWVVENNNGPVKYSPSKELVIDYATENYKIKAQVVYLNENFIAQSEVLSESEVENINVNTSFFAKLIAFFRGLFGNLPVWIDNVEQ